ncbi:hypothetical protein Hypma_013651 [Hypsizygus marmoreus]|uniref:Mid2 domain-containing protein n=1 Tax=Hypsizygus marmoreus TaxID=39966 RepID=A0A369JB93_HYPMA|nr:hypothetical protein Hypma_013651 [Hypsizygus marmoreus]
MSRCDRFPFKYLIIFMAIWPLRSVSLLLKQPVPGTGYSAILSNGPATVSWTEEPGDPKSITFEIQNNLTLDSWEFARNVDVALGTITRVLDDVSGKSVCFLRTFPGSGVELFAVNSISCRPLTLRENITHVYAESPLFTVAGVAVTTTYDLPSESHPDKAFDVPSRNPIPSSPPVTTTPQTQPLVAITSPLTSPTSSRTQIPPVTLSPKKTPVGAIVGSTIGGLTFLLLICALCFVLRRRNRPPKEALVVPLVHDQGYAQPLDKRGQLQQVLSEKAEAQRARERLQTDLERNRLEDRPPLASEGETETHLRRQMELMSHRILELEAQQRELEIYSANDQPPPNYSATAPSV